MDAVRFLVDTLLWLLTLAFLLRLLLQLARAGFRDPLADAILRVTNWLVLPLRRILPPIAKLDTATLVAVLLAAAARLGALALLGGYFAMDPVWAVRSLLTGLVDMTLRIYLFALLLYWLTGMMGAAGYASATRLPGQLCEPLLKRVRRVIPPIGQVDFSVLWLSIAIGALLILVR